MHTNGMKMNKKKVGHIDWGFRVFLCFTLPLSVNFVISQLGLLSLILPNGVALLFSIAITIMLIGYLIESWRVKLS